MPIHGNRARLQSHSVEDGLYSNQTNPLELPEDVADVLYGAVECKGLSDGRVKELGIMATTGVLRPPGFTVDDLISEVRGACSERR